MITKIKILFFYFFLLTLPDTSQADCTFKTSDFIDQLNNSKSINLIKIEIPKSSKFNKNFFRIVSSNSVTISPKFKKKFKAIVRVEYKFGVCSYNATVKQNGDFKDHIKFIDGKPFQSLNVELKNGNIQKAVKFKLLLPETRGHFNEILGSIIIRELGFIAPETFEVLVNVNGTETIMLFQETAKKEMLERNSRREGPIFEGDESLSLAFSNKNWTKFFDVSLARLTNKKWFSLGKSSEAITLNAYNKLQEAHLRNIIFFPERTDRFIISPNKNSTTAFQDYYFLMTAMHGSHALFPNNRKYYYNSFLDSFEPIYYDGNLELTKKLVSLHPILKYAFTEGYYFSIKELLHSEVFFTTVLKKFENKVMNYSNLVERYAKESLLQLLANTAILQKEISAMKKEKIPKFIRSKAIAQHLGRVEDHKIDERNINLKSRYDNYYLANDSSQNIFKISKKQLGDVISNNIFGGERSILLPQLLPPEINKEIIKKQQIKINGGGDIISSSGIEIMIDKMKKRIIINQVNSTDWVLFRNTNFTGWTIGFNGAEKTVLKKNKQRFNSHGMTGCLNFYNSHFKETFFIANGGQCEDTLNISNSKGSISSISIRNSFADAVDLDFSRISIDNLIVTNAGNDCLDLSGGSYSVAKANLINCSDKGVSVGEASKFMGNNIYVSDANIGISAKDLSKASISTYLTDNVSICTEAKQKKQEFGGALVMIGQMSCEGSLNEGTHSKIIDGTL